MFRSWRARWCLSALLSAFLLSVDASSQERPTRGDPVAEPSDPAMLQAGHVLQQFGESLGPIDWDQESVHLRRSIENVWRRNGWANEADVFALQVAQQVTEIPPWQPMERIALIADKFGERYEASSALKLRVSMLLMRESAGLLIRHGETLMAHTTEWFELRQAGQPYTTEHVARWAREGEPILRDFHEVADRVCEQIYVQLTPEQRVILQRDIDSYRKRREVVDQAMKRWAQGKWTPEEWGMADDPIQMGTKRSSGDDRRKPGADPSMVDGTPTKSSPPPTVIHLRCDEWTPERWTACAEESAQRYGFNAGQRSTADSIVAELSSRALDYQKTYRDQLDAVTPDDRPTDPVFEPLRRLFAELRDRLEAIPTTAQKEQASAPLKPSGVDDPQSRTAVRVDNRSAP